MIGRRLTKLYHSIDDMARRWPGAAPGLPVAGDLSSDGRRVPEV